MNKLLKNSEGSVLIIAVVVVMIFAILGLSLVTLTVSGIAKNQNRENIVQATDLADKGVEFAVNNLQKTLVEQIKLTPMGKLDFALLLDKTFKSTNLQCPLTENSIPDNIGYKISGENNTQTKVCIERVDNVSAEEIDLYKRNVTFKSIGYVNGKEHVTRSQVTLGTDAIPDQLRYAVSTNDGGNLFLHGGVEIQGDVKTDGNLILANHASWGTATGSNNIWTASTYPRLIKNQNSVNPKIILSPEKNIYQYKVTSNNSTNSYFTHIAETGFTNSNYNKLNFKSIDVNPYLLNTNNISIVPRDLPDDQVNIDTEFTKIPETAKSFRSLSFNDLNSTKKDTVYHIKKEKYCENYSNGKCKKETTSSGDLNLENTLSSKRNVNLVGTFFVEGDFIIDNININSDAILYVKGKVEINGSTLKGYRNDSTLFIFANGDITFSNMHDSANSSTDNINEAKGFYYSKSNLMIIGVKSHIKIIGGVSAKRIILTGIRGKGKGGSFDSVSIQPSKNARLQIIYDENLIKQFHEFKRDEEEEYITEINPPEIINRY